MVDGKVLVTGATGTLARAVLRQLGGEGVRAMNVVIRVRAKTNTRSKKTSKVVGR